MYDLPLMLWGRIRNYVTIGLGALSLGLGITVYVQSVKIDRLDSELLASQEGRLADRFAYQAAQAEYEANALRERERIEQENRERAEQADQEYADLLRRYNASIVRYRAETPQRTSSGPDLSSAPSTTEGSNGPGVGSLILIPLSDAEICAVNTARLQVVRDWVLETHTPQN